MADESKTLPTSIHLVVTGEHILAAAGQSGVYDKCPAALAFRELGYTSIDVDDARALLTDPTGSRLYCKTPRELNLFIDRFDNEEPIEPTNFLISEIRLANPEDERKTFALKAEDDDIDISIDDLDIIDSDVDEDDEI